MTSLHLRWRYASRSGFEVSGGRDALQSLSALLRHTQTGARVEATLERTDDPAPYEEVMRTLVVRKTGERVMIAKVGDSVVISGSSDHLNLLAENIEAVAQDAELEGHLHIEYYADHFYLHETSEPLVVELQE